MAGDFWAFEEFVTSAKMNQQMDANASGQAELAYKNLASSLSFTNGDSLAAEDFTSAGGANSTVNTGSTTAVFSTDKYVCQGGAGSYANSVVVCDTNTLAVDSETNSFALHWQGTFPTNTSGSFDLSNKVEDSGNFTAQSTAMGAMFLSSDGTKLYTADGGGIGGKVYQYTLSTPYKISTATYDSVVLDESARENQTSNIMFSTDGTKFYMLGTLNKTIYQYTVSTPWDISTATYASKSFLVSAQETFPTGMDISPDGTKLYVTGYSTDTIYQYTVSTPWDISTATYASKSKLVSSEDTVPQTVIITDSGSKVFMAGQTNDKIFQYTLSTPYDISTASYDSVSLPIQAGDTAPFDIKITSDGTKLYYMGTGQNAYRYTLSTAYDLSTASYTEFTNTVNYPVNSITKKTGLISKGTMSTTNDIVIKANLVTTDSSVSPTINGWGVKKL